jgi:hypothetical protein
MVWGLQRLLPLLVVLCVVDASAQDAPRQVQFGDARVEDGARIVPIQVNRMEGVLAIDLNIVLDSKTVQVLDVRTTDLLGGFFAIHNVVVDTLKFAAASAQTAPDEGGVFAELVLEDTGETPELLFSLVSFNGDEIVVEYAPRYEPSEVVTAIKEETSLPSSFHLKQNFPNPFNAETTIVFTLAESAFVELVIYNSKGQVVRTMLQGQKAAGEHRLVWDGTDGRGRRVASGRYVAKMKGVGFEREIGMVLLE